MMSAWHVELFLIAAALSAGLTYFVRRFVLHSGVAMSQPRERDVHSKPVPRLGGVAVTAAFLLITLGLYWIHPEMLTFVSTKVWGLDRNLFGILLGVIWLLGVGIADDIRSLPPALKLAAHFIAGIILAWSTVLIGHITNPLGGTIELGSLAAVFVVLWVVVMVNVINWLDGLDGLASGTSLIASLVLYFLAIKPEVNQASMAVLAVILSGSLAGFLPFNFFPAKIFLGDSGSQVLGFLLAVFSIISGGKLATAFLVLGVPILDVIWVIGRRFLAGKPIYKADTFHLHHRLLRAGLNQREAVLLLYTLSAAFGIIALQTQSFGKLVAAAILVGIMVLGGAVLVLIPLWRAKRKEV